MPEVQRASKYTTDSLVSVSASVFVPAVALYFCLRVVCIFVHAPGLFPLLPNCSLLSPICTLSLLLSNHISLPFGISLAFHAGIFPSTLPNSSLVGSKRKFSTLLLLKVTSSIDNCLLMTTEVEDLLHSTLPPLCKRWVISTRQSGGASPPSCTC